MPVAAVHRNVTNVAGEKLPVQPTTVEPSAEIAET
jgi:hypothetical protein